LPAKKTPNSHVAIENQAKKLSARR
jgi:hypothetical protein